MVFQGLMERYLHGMWIVEGGYWVGQLYDLVACNESQSIVNISKMQAQ